MDPGQNRDKCRDAGTPTPPRHLYARSQIHQPDNIPQSIVQIPDNLWGVFEQRIDNSPNRVIQLPLSLEGTLSYLSDPITPAIYQNACISE